MVVFPADLSGDGILFSFLALQLKEQEKQRDWIGIVTWHSMLWRASPASSAGSVRLLLGGFLGEHQEGSQCRGCSSAVGAP